MLKRNRKAAAAFTGGRFVIVASKYNARYVDSMLRAAVAELKKARAAEIRVVRVPGAYEIPVVVSKVAHNSQDLSAIICLGVVIRGATTHAQNITDVVSFALGTIALQNELPVIHEVLLVENEQQARERCLNKEHNRGTEAAQTALEMAIVMESL